MKEPLHPIDICVGNFIESMGNVEMVTGILKQEDGSFKIAHCGWCKGLSVLPPDVVYNTFPIPLTNEWKVCFGIDKYELPERIMYVHQAQNYFLWALGINLHEIMDWELLPKYGLTKSPFRAASKEHVISSFGPTDGSVYFIHFKPLTPMSNTNKASGQQEFQIYVYNTKKPLDCSRGSWHHPAKKENLQLYTRTSSGVALSKPSVGVPPVVVVTVSTFADVRTIVYTTPAPELFCATNQVLPLTKAPVSVPV